jgi:Xaa-Pro aminopeptidase
MTAPDMDRLDRVRREMVAARLDALVCRLPENLVYLTDYWPHHAFSVVVLAKDGTSHLFLPEVEVDYADPAWCRVSTFGWGLLKDGDLYANYRRLLSQARNDLGLKTARIGVEKSFEVVAPSYRSAEPVVPAQPWNDMLAEVFVDCDLVDAAPFLQSVRECKTAYELDKLRRANEIAEMGMREFLARLAPGQTEAEVGALVEAKIRGAGPGHRGARLVRAMAEVGAGPVGSTKGTLLVPSGPRKVEEGDIVMVELATVVDGYYSDLTYVAVAGTPNARQKEVHNAVLEAQQAAASQVRPGAKFSDPDSAARRVLEKAGLADHFVHITGHGVGLRYHEFVPFLMPGADGILQEGMVTSVEPGVYIEGFGGIRIEDNVAVGADGPLFLSTPRKPW